MRRRLIVLKLGGSVLTDRAALTRAVHEIYRWRRSGWSVVAVPSAFAGVTDARLRSAGAAAPRASARAVASAVALGELESSAELALALDRAGVPNRVAHPGAICLRGEGSPLDATPVSVDAPTVGRALERGVVIVPGFIGVDDAGSIVTFGRGGSDLTALFLADALRAERCRLVKDVDGLYERDPALPGPAPGRFAAIAWNDALRLDGSIVQHKAIAFARDRGLVFEVGAFNASRPTIVGPAPSRLEDAPNRRDAVRIAVLGAGTVGAGVIRALGSIPGVEIVGIAVADPAKQRDLPVDRRLIVGSASAAAELGPDIVIDALPDAESARTPVLRAIEGGAHVVTANKALVAAHGAEIEDRALARGVRVLASAAVGGSVPVLERLRCGQGARPTAIRAVANGTTNFVLERLSGGSSIEDALAEARSLGLAENDASRDLDGRDAACKIVVIARALGIDTLEVADIPRDPFSLDRIGGANASTTRIRQVATIRFTGASAHAEVRLESLDASDPLFDVPDEQNAFAIAWDDGSAEILRGAGAGRWPTTESVIGDVLELIRTEPRAADSDRTPSQEPVYAD